MTRRSLSRRPRLVAMMVAASGLLVFAGVSIAARSLGATTAGDVVAYFALIVFAREALRIWRGRDLAPNLRWLRKTEQRDDFDPDKTVPLKVDPDKTLRLPARMSSDRPLRRPRAARESR